MTTRARSAARQNLLDAADAGDLISIFQLLQEGNNPNFSSDNGWTPLMLAVMHEFIDIAALLLNNGADPNLVTESQENLKRSPLAVAVSNGRLEAVKLLLAHHANMEHTDANGLTALDLARRLALRPFRKEAMQDIVFLLSEAASRTTHESMLVTSAA